MWQASSCFELSGGIPYWLVFSRSNLLGKGMFPKNQHLAWLGGRELLDRLTRPVHHRTRIVSCRIVSHRIESNFILSNRVVLCRIVSRHLVYPQQYLDTTPDPVLRAIRFNLLHRRLAFLHFSYGHDLCPLETLTSP